MQETKTEWLSAIFIVCSTYEKRSTKFSRWFLAHFQHMHNFNSPIAILNGYTIAERNTGIGNMQTIIVI